MSEQGNAEPAASASNPIKSKPTRQQQLSKMLTRKSGATISQIQKTFGWQPHTARAALSALRKGGKAVERSTTEKGSLYRIAQPSAAE